MSSAQRIRGPGVGKLRVDSAAGETAIERSIVLIGSSLFTFSDTGPEDAIGPLLARRLDTLAPEVRWHWRAEAIFGNERMLGRVGVLLDECQPDIVVFEMSTYQFLHREVTRRIGRRWPRLYRPSLTLMNALKRFSGGAYEGGGSLRSKLFRLPKAAAFAAIGGDTELSLQDSLRYLFAALDEVLRREHVTLICGMPKFQWYEPQRHWCLAQVQAAREAVIAYCARHHVPTYDIEEALARAGLPPGLARDGIHYGRDSREFEAGLIAPLILQSLRS